MQQDKTILLPTCPGWWLRGQHLSRCPPWRRGSAHNWQWAWCSWVYTQWGSRVLGSPSSIGGCRWLRPWHRDQTHEHLKIEENVTKRKLFYLIVLDVLYTSNIRYPGNKMIGFSYTSDSVWIKKRQNVSIPTKRTALRMKELKLQPAAFMLASAPAPLFFRDRQQNRMASPIMIC